MFLLLLALSVGGVLAVPRQTPAVDGATLEEAVPWAAEAETGAVTGYIQPCSGTVFPADVRPAGERLFSAAALVEALPGQVHLETAADGTYRVVLPAEIAARERVAPNEAFRLDNLAPGWYVILAQYTGLAVSTHVEVSVVPGQVVTVDLPDICK
jgi:hypothetical protein